MKKYTLFLVFVALATSAQDLYPLQMSPLPLKDNGNLDLYPRTISSIQTDGANILLRSVGEGRIYVVRPDGVIAGTLGKEGMGPGEFTGGIMSFALNGDHLWVQEAKRRDQVQHIFKGEYQGLVRLDGFNVRRNAPGANNMVATDEFILVPTHPTTGKLATAYYIDGTQKHVGELIVDRLEVELLKKTPAMNDTHWITDQKYLYCIPKHYPLIIKYSMDLQEVSRFHLDKITPIQLLFQEIVLDFKPGGAVKWALPLFTDVQFFDGSLFLMSQKHLFELDTATGAFKRLYTFPGGHHDLPEMDLNVLSFAILDNATLVLRGSPGWKHELYKADLSAIR